MSFSTPATASSLGGVELRGALGGSTDATNPAIPAGYVTAAMLAQQYALEAELQAEVTRAETAESQITAGYQAAVDAEIAARTTALSSETSTRASADSGLSASITTLQNNYTTLTSAVSTNTSAISTEATARQAGDSTNAANITANTTAINNEVTRAEAAETANTNSINAEVTRAQAAEATKLAKASNLSDLASASTARTNLGLGSAATQNTTAFDAAGAASTVQTALNSEISRAEAAEATKLTAASNLSDLASATTARANLGLGSAATHASTDFDAAGTSAAETTRAQGVEAAKANDNAVVHLSGTETVTGSKNFTGGLQSSGTNVVTTTDARLSDNRTPLAGSVVDSSVSGAGLTNAAISATAAIAHTKLDAATQTAITQAGTAVQSVNGHVGTAITLGANDVGASPNLIPTTVRTANYTAQPGDFVICDISGGSFTVPLPTAPANLTSIAVKVVKTNTARTNALTIATGAGDVFNISGGSTTLTLMAPMTSVVLQYALIPKVWYVRSTDQGIAPVPTQVSNADYTATNSDQVIIYTSLTAPHIVTLPTGQSVGQSLVIADQTGYADQYPIIVIGAINNGPAAVIKAPWGRMSLIWSGSQWQTDSWSATARPAVITGTTYYVDAVGGLDTNNGTSTATAWQTVAKARSAVLNPGDGILFKGGQNHNDAQFWPNGGSGYTGTYTSPIIFGSYGTGQAILSQGIWFIGGSYMVFDNLALTGNSTFQGGNNSNLVNNCTVQRCTISDVGDTTSTAAGLLINGSDWIIVGNYIHDLPSHGMLIGSANDGNSGGFTIARNLCYNIGRNTSLGFNPHFVYGDAHDVVVQDNIATAYGYSSAISQRYRNWTIADNHLAGASNQIGIDIFQTDTIPGQSIWRHNRIIANGPIYVDGGTQVIESLRISENQIDTLAGGNSVNIHRPTGTLEVWGNTINGGSPAEAQGDPAIELFPSRVLTGIAQPTYGVTVTPDPRQGTWQTITVTNATAFTIAAPIAAPGATRSSELVIEILNGSGGAMGTITWNAAFVFATGAWANPANTKRRFARFIWNGSAWICTSLSTSDY